MCVLLGSEPAELSGSPLKVLSSAPSRPRTELRLGIFLGQDLLGGMFCVRSSFAGPVDRKPLLKS